MKLRERLPRLSRKQRVVRNLLLTVLALFLTWMVCDFRAPTPGLALRWELEGCGLEADEILYQEDWEDRERTVVLRAGDFYVTAREQKDGVWGYEIPGLLVKETAEPVTILQRPTFYYRRGDLSFFAIADIPGAERAVCSLRMRGSINTTITVEETQVADEHYDWDETYVMEGTSGEGGVWRFLLRRKYPEDNDAGYQEQTRQMAENSIFRNFQYITRGSADRDFICDLRLVFYDSRGNEVETYEETLWDKTT